VIADPRPPGAPRRVWRDYVLVVVAGGFTIAEALLRTDVLWRWANLVIGLTLIALLPYRRTFPLAVAATCFATGAVLSVGQLATGAEESGYYGMAVIITSLYAVVRWGSGREAVIGVAISLVTATIAVIADSETLSDVIGGFATLVVIIAVGFAVRSQRAARQRAFEQVRAAEREHLARDLHDTVAHHVTAIAVRAQAGIAVAATQPDAALDALRVIEAEAVRTLGAMRGVVGVLRRDEPAERAPVPTLDDLHRLRAPADSGGPRVDVSIADDARDVGEAAATAVFRIAQESLTNVRRHAKHATRVDVSVTGDEIDDRRVIRVRIADDGDPVDRTAGTGYGIVGMIERAELLGGTCTAGPADTRGWIVTASFPADGSSS
jgi:signal transduction histidine kinase